MNFLQKFSSSLIGYICRTFINVHSVVWGIFGLGYILYLKNFHLTKQDIYSFSTIVFISSIVITYLYYSMHSFSKWTFKRIIRVYFNNCIGIILALGFLTTWYFFQGEYKNGYFSLAFNIATVQAIVLYFLAFISDTILRNQNELREFQQFIKQQFKKGKYEPRN
ncbi:hypothetical protein COO16_04085 [Bacillus pseudomycoides]|uniref:hypothetical protein n=1 Tax=Bacillus pseudomycoides TaxID=64104 RepID=UPI000BED2E2B|nr:hypothetical protein [Bacillus pseudomycoides]PDY14149.1 hypothetical protein COO16_04085 [Bacillus pseudomycoides]